MSNLNAPTFCWYVFISKWALMHGISRLGLNDYTITKFSWNFPQNRGNPNQTNVCYFLQNNWWPVNKYFGGNFFKNGVKYFLQFRELSSKIFGNSSQEWCALCNISWGLGKYTQLSWQIPKKCYEILGGCWEIFLTICVENLHFCLIFIVTILKKKKL